MAAEDEVALALDQHRIRLRGARNEFQAAHLDSRPLPGVACFHGSQQWVLQPARAVHQVERLVHAYSPEYPARARQYSTPGLGTGTPA